MMTMRRVRVFLFVGSVWSAPLQKDDSHLVAPQGSGMVSKKADWKRSYSVDPPYETLSGSDYSNNLDGCLALCTAKSYNTCAAQCNG